MTARRSAMVYTWSKAMSALSPGEGEGGGASSHLWISVAGPGVLVYERRGEMSPFFCWATNYLLASLLLPPMSAWLDLLHPTSTWHREFTQEGSDSLSASQLKERFQREKWDVQAINSQVWKQTCTWRVSDALVNSGSVFGCFCPTLDAVWVINNPIMLF